MEFLHSIRCSSKAKRQICTSSELLLSLSLFFAFLIIIIFVIVILIVNFVFVNFVVSFGTRYGDLLGGLFICLFPFFVCFRFLFVCDSSSARSNGNTLLPNASLGQY